MRSSVLAARLLLLILILAAAGCAPVVDPSAIGGLGEISGPPPPSDIYRSLAPSVAYIETPAGTGSGLLIDLHGAHYIVTNAHVVWPFSDVRIVFPDGEEHLEVPLVADDMLVDLAIVGPVNTSVSPAEIAFSRDIETGDTVYLIGYPGEAERFPVPAISQGILSRTRTWNAVDNLRYFQTDAASAGGQSGGVLVSGDGDIIGFSGMLFHDAFVLATSSADLSERLDHMAAQAGGEQATTARPLPRRFRGELDNLWDTDGYLAYASDGETIRISVASSSDIALSLLDAGPDELDFADETFNGTETVSTTATVDAPYIVVVEQYDPDQASYQVRSSHSLQAIADTDDGLTVEGGEAILGTLDYPGDIDWYSIAVAAGDEFTATVDATGIDPVLYVGPRGARADEYAEDDDGGRGMLGSNASLHYRANSGGEHLIVVRSFGAQDVGGYILNIGPLE